MKILGESDRDIKNYFIAIIISLILGGLVIVNTNIYLNNMVRQSLVEIAKMGAKNIENNIEWHFDRLELLSESEIIYSDKYSIEDKLEYLNQSNKSNTHDELAYITTDGVMYVASGMKFDVSREKFFLEAKEGKRAVEMMELMFYPDYPAIAFTYPVFHNNSIKSFVSLIYSTEGLCEIVENIKFGNQGYGYIIDSDGFIIAHIDRSIVKNKERSIDDANHDPSLKKLADLEMRMLKGETGSGSYIYNGQKKIMGFSRIENASWSFAATSLEKDAFDNASTVVTIVTLVVGTFCLSLILIQIYFLALSKKSKREEKTLRNAVETANIIIISFLDDGIILEFNINAANILGYDPKKIIKIFSIYDLLTPNDQQKLKRELEEHRKGLTIKNFELSMITAEGKTEYVLFNLNIINKDSAAPTYELMGICITDRVMSERQLIEKHEELTAVYEQLAASEEELKDQLDELIRQKMLLQEKDDRHNLVVEASNIGICDWDVKRDTYFYSQKWYDILEVEKGKISGNERTYRLNAILREDREIAEKAYVDCMNRITPYFECEYRIMTPTGKIKWIYEVGKTQFDSLGNLIRMAGALSDITVKKESEERIHKLAYYDTLTGLPNRSRLTEKFYEIAKVPERKIAIIIIDIDSFKLINDSYGHEIGDKLLVEVSERLHSMNIDNSYIARMAGDDFAVMVWDYEDESRIIEIVTGLLNCIDGMAYIGDYSIVIETNIGVALYPKDGSSFDIIYKNADTAKFQADEKRMKYAFYNQDMNDAILERLNLQNSLRTALNKKEFVLFYQPQYRAADKKIMGFEALVRWNSEHMGMVPPTKFIPIAEETHFIIPLGAWILEEAVKFIKRLHNLGHTDLIMSVNISSIQFNQKDFSEFVIDLINRYDLPPKTLELEITETVMMGSMDNVINNMNRIREIGIRIALDDFGTGYSSLNYLTKIPINTLKIDKVFIDDVGLKRERSLLVETIVNIAHALGLSIVAEGVETEEQYMYLLEHKCERIQGYYFSKPLPEDKVMDLITDH